jgi:hypothetical protein
MIYYLQLELHVYNPQHELLSYLNEKGITPQAYSPLGSSNSPLLTDDVVVKIATKHSLQPSDILLGYLRMSISALLCLIVIVIGAFIFSCKGNCCASQICHACPYYVQFYGRPRCREQVKV